MDFQLFVNALLQGSPIALLAALVGLIWQLYYVRSRDRLNDGQVRRQHSLEEQRFEHEKALAQIRFEYEQRKWREDLSREAMIKLMDRRVTAYVELWQAMRPYIVGQQLPVELAREMATFIRNWRYQCGDIIAEILTYDAIVVLQKALWEYDETPTSLHQVRTARRVFLKSLRADIGLGQDTEGRTLYDLVEQRQHIRADLQQLQRELKIDPLTA